MPFMVLIGCTLSTNKITNIVGLSLSLIKGKSTFFSCLFYPTDTQYFYMHIFAGLRVIRFTVRLNLTYVLHLNFHPQNGIHLLT